MSRGRAAQIERLERDGVMARRREELRAWFQPHPLGTAQQAVRELRYTHADHMYLVADSVRWDCSASRPTPARPRSQEPGAEGGQ